MSPNEYRSALDQKLSAFDKQGAIQICENLVQFLYQSAEPFDKNIGKNILQLLRNKRMFDTMQKVADALIFTERHSLKIYRQYAQSLIDSGDYSAALAVLNNLISDTKNTMPDNQEAKAESIEAEGLIGRLYKQLYVDASKLGSFNGAFLRKALQSYYTVYIADPRSFLWHGINVVALLYRAKQDGIAADGYPSYRELAEKILAVVEEKDTEKKAETWDYATAAEACIALGQTKDAERWIASYAADRYCDAFELASTLRQFEELWKLDAETDIGKKVLAILRSQLLKREGGGIVLQADEIKRLKEDDLSLEKNFGNNIFIDFQSYKKGYTCCESVARIGRITQKGDGTGFLLNRRELNPNADDKLVLITNAHVISTDPSVRAVFGALDPAEAIIIFEALNRNEEFRVGEVLFQSPPQELDVTIISFRSDEMDRLKKLVKDVTLYKLSPVLPVAGGNPLTDPRLYVIGHPKGGPLQFSMQDNLLLDSESPRLHYRTPTEGGSSGSPVFNQQWELVALHHAGKKDMKKLNGKEGAYEANEGIWMQSIKKAFEQVSS